MSKLHSLLKLNKEVAIMNKILISLLLLFYFSCLSTNAKEIKVIKLKNPQVKQEDICIEKDEITNVYKNKNQYKLKVVKLSVKNTKNPWDVLKGTPAGDALLLNMLSFHTSSKKYNSTNDLLGIQYKGYILSTLVNSYDERTFFAGVGRKLIEKELKSNSNCSLGIGYRAGLIHGYGDKYPNLIGFTPLVLPVFSLDYKRLGADLIVIPGKRPVFTLNFRFNIRKKKKLMAKKYRV